MVKKSLYAYAHLIVAAIRVLEHRTEAPPAIDDVSDMLQTSIEETYRLCRKIKELEVIEMLDNAGTTRLFIKDHRKIEDIADQPEESRLEAELKKFKEARQSGGVDLESVKAKQTEKKSRLHEELEQKLKQNLKK
ncbi:MAG TPA: hypothetical protein VKO20_09935 [Desulfosalsimonadaceae bacterium]|nr:hypothetical protein [Desulfosalsimonadaceae bacterium]